MISSTFFFVLVTLAAVGTLRVETAALDSEVAERLSNIFENRERETRQSCQDLTRIIDGDLSGLSQQCKDAIQINSEDPINGALCTSACNDIYQASVQCYGAEATRIAYQQLCANGFQGGV